MGNRYFLLGGLGNLKNVCRLWNTESNKHVSVASEELQMHQTTAHRILRRTYVSNDQLQVVPKLTAHDKQLRS